MGKKVVSLILSLIMIISLVGTVGLVSTTAADTDPNGIYVTPVGSGAKNGAGWENAMEGDKAGGLQEAWLKVGETGTLYIGSGVYSTQQTLNIKKETSGKSLDAMKSVVGVDTGYGKPVFKGVSTLENQTGTFIEIGSGVSFIRIDNLRVENYCYPISTRGKHTGLRISNIDAFEMADGIYLRGGAKADNPLDGNKDIIIDNCNFTKHTKSAIRILEGNNGVLVSNCTADAGGQEYSNEKSFALSFHACGGDGVWDENITYVNCVGMNSYQQPKNINEYWNGDSFCSEGETRNITYIRCRAYNNTDGGWDDKVKNPTLIDCITINNKRNWRFWNGATIINGLNAVPQHPDPRLGPHSGMWAGRYSSPKIYNSTFYNSWIGVELGGAEVYDSIFTRATPGDIFGDKLIEGQTFVKQGVITWDGVNGTDPQFKDPTDMRFDGKSDKFNSQVFGPSKGYYYSGDLYKSKMLPTNEMKSTGFVDVTSAYSWAKESIDFMTGNDFMPGLTTAAFAPYANMTRVQFASMLVRTLGIKAEANGNFTDMDRFKKWKDPLYGVQYYNDIAIAKAAGVLKGDESGFFNPGNTITRQDMMVMLGRALKIVGKLPADYNANLSALDAFSDKDSIADYAKQEVANMIEKGIIKGGTDGKVNPIGQAIRAEGVVIGKRIFDFK